MDEIVCDRIPTYPAPPDGRLTDEMVHDYREAGVLVLEGFVSSRSCRQLRERALELIEGFDPQSVRHVFSSTHQTQLQDRYFYESGDKIRFFLEDDAFDENGQLKQSKEHSLNKIGHAMHDLDPVFNAFSRTPELAAVVASLGVREPGIIQSMYIFKPPRIGGLDFHLHRARVLHRLLVCSRGRDPREWLPALHSGRAQDAAQATQLPS